MTTTQPPFIDQLDADTITIIVAHTDDNVIGSDGEIPWYYSDDLAQFRTHTVGNAVIMGRKTFESIEARIGGPLPDRRNIVLSNSRQSFPDGAIHASGIEEALDKVHEDERPYIAGGEAVYEQFLPLADAIVRTNIPDAVDGDTFFPELSDEWTEVDTVSLNDTLTVSLLRR